MRISFAFLCMLIASVSANAQSVGIGTTTPNSSAQLDVTSTTKGFLIPRMTSAQRTAIAGPAAGLMVYETTTNSLWIYNGSGWVQQASGGASPWTTSGTNIFNTNSGKVGIGTSSPNASAELDVSSTNTGLLVPRMTTTQRNAIASPATGLLVYDNTLKEFYHHDGTAWRQMINSSNNLWKSSSVFSFVYNNTDSIGIGTSSPDQKLHVANGKIYVQDNRSGQDPHVIFDIPNADGNEGGLQFSRSPGDTLAAVNYVSDASFPDYIRIGVGNAGKRNDLTVNTNGEIGVGTFIPAGEMQLSSYNGDNLVISDVDGSIQFSTPAIPNPVKRGFIQLSNTYDLRLGTNSGNTSGRFIIRTNGGDRVFVDETGNVSIGTTATAAGYKLHIGGKAICEELKVQLIANWPDYVFAKNYRLTPIDELKKYIDENNHLPEMPAAAEAEKNGVEVGDMQKRLLKKVEELTLYIVQLKQEIDELKAKKN